jgi:hypothetical protein
MGVHKVKRSARPLLLPRQDNPALDAYLAACERERSPEAAEERRATARKIQQATRGLAKRWR